MKKLYKFNINGHECYLTQATYRKVAIEIQRYNAEKAEAEWERNSWKIVDKVYQTWKATGDMRDWDYYSDIHKDYYGFRP